MLELKSVSKAFGMIVVASDIDLSLARGEALGIIGPNGAGKSTLFNLITGMLRPDRGRILLEGRDITGLPPEQRCRAGSGGHSRFRCRSNIFRCSKISRSRRCSAAACRRPKRFRSAARRWR